MSIKDLTIIITAFKSDKIINNCLNSIADGVKVIIVDNSNNHKLKNEIEKEYSNVEYILSKDNIGYSRANNLGLNKSKTKYCLVLNPDTVLRKDSLDKFINTIKIFPDFSLMGPANGQGKINAKKIKKSGKNLLQVKNLKGFAIFFNMSKFNEVYFDENYFSYFEEIDLCNYVEKNKGKIYLDPDIYIEHKEASSVESKFTFEIEKNRNWHWMWSTFYYHKKYKGYIIAIIIIAPKLFSSLLKTLYYSLVFNNKKRDVYLSRLSGLINSILLRKSWYRPSID